MDVPTLEPEPLVEPRRAIPADRNYRGGGKPGRTNRPAPQVLRDMRLVYGKPDAAHTPGQKALRSMFESSPQDFLRELARLESAHASAASPIQPLDLARHSPAVPEPAAA